jgi:hypothetical protein
MAKKYIRKGPGRRIRDPYGVERVDEKGVKRLYYYSRNTVRNVFSRFVRTDYDGEIHLEKNRELINNFYDRIEDYHKTKDPKKLEFLTENISHVLTNKRDPKWIMSSKILVVASDDFYRNISNGLKKLLKTMEDVHLVKVDDDALKQIPPHQRVDYLNRLVDESFKKNIDKLKSGKWIVLTDVWTAVIVKPWVEEMKMRDIDVEAVYLFSSN